MGCDFLRIQQQDLYILTSKSLLLLFLKNLSIILGLSLVDTILMKIISGLVLFIVLSVVSLNYMQQNHKQMLPRVLEDWRFLPKPLRTFGTIDYIVQTYMEVGAPFTDYLFMILFRFTVVASCGEQWRMCLWLASVGTKRTGCSEST